MPFLSDTGGIVSEGITIDGTTYRHGETYTVPYGRALLIRDIIYRSQQAELEFEGKGRLHGLRQQRAEIFNEVRFRATAICWPIWASMPRSGRRSSASVHEITATTSTRVR